MSKKKGTDTGSEGRWARLPGVVLMVLVLMVAGLLSALTAMRVVIRGREVEVPELLGKTEAEAARLLVERSVKVLVSLGERRFSVPDVEGASLRATQLMLTQRGLSVGNTLFAHTNGGEPSTVVYQSPEAGDIGASDPAVNVLVSLGPIDQYYVMPDLQGSPALPAIDRVKSEGFRLGEITYTRNAGVRAGVIVQQQPPAGYKLSKTDIILLEVSQ